MFIILQRCAEGGGGEGEGGEPGRPTSHSQPAAKGRTKAFTAVKLH